jgi:transposase, IS30 family
MKGYRHLTQQQRFIIQDLCGLGKTFRAIAEEIGVHRTTVSRELKRNCNLKGGYKALGAQSYTNERRKQIHEYSRKIDGALEELVIEKLKEAWSPEQISGRLKEEAEGGWSISHETIYKWIYNVEPTFMACLRWKSKRRWRGHKKRKRGLGKRPRKMIDARPAAANTRLEMGHWERDLLEGKRSGPSLLVAVDRRSRYTKMDRVFSHQSHEVNQATLCLLSKEKNKKSITNDNGVEFGGYETVERKIHVPVYYTHPYTSWERGTVENTNGLIRQFYPKHFDFWQTTSEEIKEVEKNLNHRPRKTLGFKTPYEVHFSTKQKLIKSETTYKKQRSKRNLKEEKQFWLDFYRENLRALKY